MGDPIDSHGWTGPDEDSRIPRAFTHAAGQHPFTSDYSRLLAAQLAAEAMPSELKAVRLLAAYLFISPLLLWLAHVVVAAWIADHVVQDWVGILVLEGLFVAATAALLFSIKSTALLWLRRGLTLSLILATAGAAGAYAYLALKAHATARLSRPERAFLVSRRDRVNFEREDGSRLIGASRTRRSESGECVSVTLLEGDYGFTWARVVERVSRERHELFWPSRREDCFSTKPLGSLRR